MNKLLIGLAAVPLMSSVAFAAQPLSDKQMDAVTAGFTAFSTGFAEAYGGVTTAAETQLAEVAVLRNASGAPVTVPTTVSNGAGGTVTLEVQIFQIKSVAASSSLSTAANLPSLNSPF